MERAEFSAKEDEAGSQNQRDSENRQGMRSKPGRNRKDMGSEEPEGGESWPGDHRLGYVMPARERVNHRFSRGDPEGLNLKRTGASKPEMGPAGFCAIRIG